MQHHRVPTRLLDWTESFALALYFAPEDVLHDGVNPRSKNSCACIWILNPYRLAFAAGAGRIVDLRMFGQYDYVETFLREGNWPFEEPIPIYPPWTNARIVVQKGFFTLHGLGHKPLNAVKLSFDGGRRFDVCGAVPLPASAIDGSLGFLRKQGLDRYSVYADKDSLADDLKSRFFTKHYYDLFEEKDGD